MTPAWLKFTTSDCIARLSKQASSRQSSIFAVHRWQLSAWKYTILHGHRQCYILSRTSDVVVVLYLLLLLLLWRVQFSKYRVLTTNSVWNSTLLWLPLLSTSNYFEIPLSVNNLIHWATRTRAIRTQHWQLNG